MKLYLTILHIQIILKQKKYFRNIISTQIKRTIKEKCAQKIIFFAKTINSKSSIEIKKIAFLKVKEKFNHRSLLTSHGSTFTFFFTPRFANFQTITQSL